MVHDTYFINQPFFSTKKYIPFVLGPFRTRHHVSVVRGLLDTVHKWNLNIFAIAQCTLRVQPNLVSSISQLAKIKLNLLSSCSAYESGLVYRRGDFKTYLFATCISTHTNYVVGIYDMDKASLLTENHISLHNIFEVCIVALLQTSKKNGQFFKKICLV